MQTAALAEGRHIHPATAKLTVEEWCDQWLAGYGTRRASTVRQAGVHLADKLLSTSTADARAR